MYKQWEIVAIDLQPTRNDGLVFSLCLAPGTTGTSRYKCPRVQPAGNGRDGFDSGQPKRISLLSHFPSLLYNFDGSDTLLHFRRRDSDLGRDPSLKSMKKPTFGMSHFFLLSRQRLLNLSKGFVLFHSQMTFIWCNQRPPASTRTLLDHLLPKDGMMGQKLGQNTPILWRDTNYVRNVDQLAKNSNSPSESN